MTALITVEIISPGEDNPDEEGRTPSPRLRVIYLIVVEFSALEERVAEMIVLDHCDAND